MKLGLKGTIVAALACVALTNVQTTNAAHVTNFLDTLHIEVSNHLAGVELSKADEKALNAANKALLKNTKTLGADVAALASAARTLEKAFPSNETFIAASEQAFDAYANEAQAQLADVEARLGTNTLKKGYHNQLSQAALMLAGVLEDTNSVSIRAKGLAKVFNKLRVPVAYVRENYEIQFEAPAAETAMEFQMIEDAPSPSETSKVNFMANNEGYRYYHIDQPEEEGTWSYTKTGPRTATIHCNADYPSHYDVTYDVTLVFTTPTTGTFTGRTHDGAVITGNFEMVLK